MSPEAVVLLLGFLVAHYLGDFTPLATERMQAAKAEGGPMGPVAQHAAVHGLLVGAVAALVARPGWQALALAAGVEFASHFLVDAGRARITARVEALRDPDRRLFWAVLGADQLIHGAVLVAIAALVV